MTEKGIDLIQSVYEDREDIGNIHSLVVDDELLVAGFQGGHIEVIILLLYSEVCYQTFKYSIRHSEHIRYDVDLGFGDVPKGQGSL